MLASKGSSTHTLSDHDVQQLLYQASNSLSLHRKRVLIIIPDRTRTAPIPLLFRLFYEQFGHSVSQLDYLIALGTHPPLDDAAIDQLVGVSHDERKEHYPNVRIFNHEWSHPNVLQHIGTISREETAHLTDNLLSANVAVTLNRLIFEYDHLFICGPVFPHEVVGFSGGAKYLFPGIAGADIINFTHWLGALVTSMKTIGVKDTPVRRVIHRVAQFVTRPITCIALVMQEQTLHGMYIGSYEEAFNAAADLSAQLNIVYVDRPYRRILSQPAALYDDLWTAAKAMYKTEPAIAGGGEVIIYAPHISEISYTHGKLIDEVGYHVRDYFTKQWNQFAHIPGTILAHSTHVKGTGSYDPDSKHESPRIHVTLATSIPEERCRSVNLGYLDYHTIVPEEWQGHEDEGILYLPHAGEILYRAKSLMTNSQGEKETI